MGHIDLLGWAIVKSFVHDDASSIKDLWEEKKYLKEHFKNDMLKDKNKRVWVDIQTEKDMKFDELVRVDQSEFPFFNGAGSRYMKYESTNMENPILTSYFPSLYALFDANNLVCQEYLHKKTNIRCTYVSASRNFLANDGPVYEQYMHTDYDTNPYVNK